MSHSTVPISRPMTKKTLVTVSHAIEQAALAAAEDRPVVVLAMFQRLAYFDRERAVYERIAEHAAVTVVGLVARELPRLPAGVWCVPLRDSEPLAREWSVVVLSPRFGAMLVAQDREEVDPAQDTLEAGRLFDGGWCLRRDEALFEVVRLRAALHDRLPEAVLAQIDAVVDRVRLLPSAPGEARAEAALMSLTDRVERSAVTIGALRRELAAGRRAGREQHPALIDQAAARRWAGRTTTSGTLPVALVAVRFTAPEEPGAGVPRESEALRQQGVFQTLTAVLRSGDRIVRIDAGEFILVMPSLGQDAAVALAYQLNEEIRALSSTYPFVSTTATCVVAVTRDRPLPFSRVTEALTWAVGENVPVATVAQQPG